MSQEKAQLTVVVVPVLNLASLVASHFVQNANICAVSLPGAKVKRQVFYLFPLSLVDVFQVETLK